VHKWRERGLGKRVCKGEGMKKDEENGRGKG